jgi:hypothetical protein
MQKSGESLSLYQQSDICDNSDTNYNDCDRILNRMQMASMGLWKC